MAPKIVPFGTGLLIPCDANVVTKGFPARELKLSVAVWQVELFKCEDWIYFIFFRRIRRIF